MCIRDRARGCKVTGATVHFVNEECDGGPILLQKAVDILPGDTPEAVSYTHLLQLPIVGGVDRNGAQQVAVSFLVSAVTQVELLHDILDAPMQMCIRDRIRTVLPTPAPPNRPILPPLA